MSLQHITNSLLNEEPNNYKIFTQILDRLLEEVKDTITMLELGCGSAYYSALFHERFKLKAKNILVEPHIQWYKNFGEGYFADKKNIYFYNNFIEKLVWAHWGGENDTLALKLQEETTQISVEKILQETHTNYVDILHMDMQGSEYYVLNDIINTNIITKFNYIVIMTHNFNDINYQSYIDLVQNSKIPHEFIYIDANYVENGDGLIVLKINS
jgi:FkbM family methyltransferase